MPVRPAAAPCRPPATVPRGHRLRPPIIPEDRDLVIPDIVGKYKPWGMTVDRAAFGMTGDQRPLRGLGDVPEALFIEMRQVHHDAHAVHLCDDLAAVAGKPASKAGSPGRKSGSPAHVG